MKMKPSRVQWALNCWILEEDALGSAVDEFPRISEYGAIGDGRTAALLASNGSIEWLCLPHFDSKPCFSSMLDRERGGHFSICPLEPYSSRQYYLKDSNVLATEFTTRSGRARILDCFATTSEANKKSRLWPEQEIIRISEGIEGEVRFAMSCDPRFEFGREIVRAEKFGAIGMTWRTNSFLLFLQTNLSLDHLVIGGPFASDASTVFDVRAGDESIQFSMTFSSTGPAVLPPVGAEAKERFQLAHSYWQSWSSRCRYVGPFADEVRRSALALKLMTFAPSGAIVAAVSTSLPEDPGGKRNWDYRYCWLRDASFTVRALIRLGYFDEACAFVGWMLHSTRLTHPLLEVLYSVFGGTNVPERALTDLRGYRSSQPVRVGNGAFDQLQLDVYGEVLDSVYIALEHLQGIDSETRHFILGMGNAVSRLWSEPDDGIWEARSGRRHHTHSKVLCWVALERLISLCEICRWKAPIDQFRKVQEDIRHEIEARGFNEKIGAYTQTFDGAELDASLLVLPLVGYCPSDSPRMRDTIRAIRRSLSADELVYRYRGVDDGVPGHEGAFGICSFWLIECIAKAGDLSEARRLFEAFMKRKNEVGLWSEEIDPRSGDFLGNYPQAFTHVGFINCVLTLYGDEAR